jgi:hypothetical protein
MEAKMSIAGKWKITIKTMMGDQNADLDLAVDGAALTGTMSGQGSSVAVTEGAVNGDDFSWKASITQPMALELEFSGTVAGDRISGQVKAGAFGYSPFEGGRA